MFTHAAGKGLEACARIATAAGTAATLAPGNQRMIHWMDEAAFFRVVMDRFARWYGGLFDLAVTYSFADRPTEPPPDSHAN